MSDDGGAIKRAVMDNHNRENGGNTHEEALSWIAGIAGTIVLASGAAAQQAPNRDATIGIVTLQMRAPYFVAMVRALEAEGAKRGIKTVSPTAAATPPKYRATSKICSPAASTA